MERWEGNEVGRWERCNGSELARWERWEGISLKPSKPLKSELISTPPPGNDPGPHDLYFDLLSIRPLIYIQVDSPKTLYTKYQTPVVIPC